MKILIVGAGYVGLVSAACMAEMGHHVTCLDIDEKKIDDLSKGILPIYEPGLKDLVETNLKAKRLRFTTSYKEGLAEAQVCFIAVATPQAEDGSCDLSHVFSCAQSIAEHIKKDTIVAIKSTVPVGTAEKVKEIVDVDVVSNPEFLKEGAAVTDCMKPDRVIVGADSKRAEAVMHELYSAFMMSRDRMVFMSVRSAELTKYAANAMLATRISFMNELANLCELLGANIHEIRAGIGSDSRIGHQFLYAGVGYGGSCFPKDLKAFQAMGYEAKMTMLIIDAVEKVNREQKLRLAQKIKSYFSSFGGLQGKVIALWGLAFKPGTDDMREAPSLDLIEDLLSAGASLRLFDPIAAEKAKWVIPEHPEIYFASSEYEAAEGADAIALVTEWKQFRFADLTKIRQTMRGKGFFDGRNQYKPYEMKEKGFDYHCIGVCFDPPI